MEETSQWVPDIEIGNIYITLVFSYHFDNDGVMQKDAWIDDDHYVDSEGKLVSGKKRVTPTPPEPPKPVDENAYRVVLNGNGATSGSMSDMNVKVGVSVSLNDNTYKRNGYTFKGWSTTQKGKKIIKNKAVIKILPRKAKP